MSSPNTHLRIDRLNLRNFRCFTECSIDLHPCLTVLVAENALGKTALIDALRLALNVFVTTMGRSKQCPGFESTDIHLAKDAESKMHSQLPTQFTAEGYISSESVTWSRILNSDKPHARSSTKDTKEIRTIAQKLSSQLSITEYTRNDESTLVLPIASYYGTGRLWDEHRLTTRKRQLASANITRMSAYLDCLSPSSSYKSFATWYEQTADAVRDSRYKAVDRESRPENYLAAVREAVRTVLEPTGWTTIDWQFPIRDVEEHSYSPGYIVVEHPENGRLPLSHLSDGIRNMVALVGDLAHRCVRLNPHLGEKAARLTPGILLIDEVDMHLHPRWQQLVIELLQQAFPTMQMVFTTHSPQVLSTVKKESIRVVSLDNGKGLFTTPEHQTRGVESTDVLTGVMKVNPIPQVEEAQWLNDYRNLIETGNHNGQEGLELRNKLMQHLAENHPLIQDCDRLIRFQNFKLHKRRNEPS